MRPPIGPTHDEVLREEFERDPEFAAEYEAARIEGNLALALADIREKRGLTQRALAEATGIAQPMIARIERASQVPTVTTLYKIAAALKATVEIGPDGIDVRPSEEEPAHTVSDQPEMARAASVRLPEPWSESVIDVGRYIRSAAEIVPLQIHGWADFSAEGYSWQFSPSASPYSLFIDGLDDWTLGQGSVFEVQGRPLAGAIGRFEAVVPAFRPSHSWLFGQQPLARQMRALESEQRVDVSVQATQQEVA